MAFQSIGKAIQFKVAAVGLTRSLEAAVILARINTMAAGRYEAKLYRKGRLTVIAPSPIAAQELLLRKFETLTEINQLFDEPLIKELAVRS